MTMASLHENGWWRAKGLLLVAVAAGLASGFVPPVGWKPACQALVLAALWADYALGWIKTVRVRMAILIATALLSALAFFGPPIPASIAFISLGAFAVVTISRTQREAAARRA
jgi:hypothetical protein